MTEAELRDLFVRTAATYIGVREGSAEHHALVDRYNSHMPLARGYALQYTDPWCAGFVSAVAIECGLTQILPTEVGCGKMIALFQDMGSWVEEDSYLPGPGDVIFYDWDDSGTGNCTGSADHVGIVETVAGNTLTVIEGNYSDMVKRRSLQVNGRYIRGYGVPDFKSLEVTQMRYSTLEQIPEYAAPTITKLMEQGCLLGKGGDELDLSEDMVRILVVLDRKGLLG